MTELAVGLKPLLTSPTEPLVTVDSANALVPVGSRALAAPLDGFALRLAYERVFEIYDTVTSAIHAAGKHAGRFAIGNSVHNTVRALDRDKGITMLSAVGALFSGVIGALTTAVGHPEVGIPLLTAAGAGTSTIFYTYKVTDLADNALANQRKKRVSLKQASGMLRAVERLDGATRAALKPAIDAYLAGKGAQTLSVEAQSALYATLTNTGVAPTERDARIGKVVAWAAASTGDRASLAEILKDAPADELAVVRRLLEQKVPYFSAANELPERR